MPTKKYLRKKLKNVFNGSNCDQKSQRSGILTEPLYPRRRKTEGNGNLFNQFHCSEYVHLPS